MSYPAKWKFTDKRYIVLPKSAAKGRPNTYIRLVTNIHETPGLNGFKFEGPLFRPGEPVERYRLLEHLCKIQFPHPEEGYRIVMLECGGSAVGQRNGWLYVLWNLVQDKWIEVCRTVSTSWTWTTDLAPIAKRLLEEGIAEPDAGDDRAPDLSDIATTLGEDFGSALDRELRRLDTSGYVQLLDALQPTVENILASRRAQAAAGVKLH